MDSGLLGSLRSIPRPRLAALIDAEGIEDAADDLVADAGEVADTAAADEHNGVLLQVMAFTGDIGGQFLAVGQADTGDLPQSRVRLLGGHRADLKADAALGGTAFEEGRLRLGRLLFPRFTDELVDRRHSEQTRIAVMTGAGLRRHCDRPPDPGRTNLLIAPVGVKQGPEANQNGVVVQFEESFIRIQGG